MKTVNTTFKYVKTVLIWIILGLLITFTISSCSFCVPTRNAICSLFVNTPLKDLTFSDRKIVFEDPSVLIVYHGSGCSESNKSGTEEIIRVEQSAELPVYATNATVFLNGWDFEYIDGDHKIGEFGTTIRNIRVERNTLKWEAVGVFSDKNFDDGYKWCYRYTIIAWNPANLNLVVDHQDRSCDNVIPAQATFYGSSNNSTTTALSTYASFIQNPIFASVNNAFIIPRGFGFRWKSCGEDNNLLQLAYNMDHSENFLEHAKKYTKADKDTFIKFTDSASHTNDQILSWETSAIFKDDKLRRTYEFGEVVTGLGGNDIGIIQPSFSILPIEDEQGFNDPCVWGGNADSVEYIIKDIPYQFAIPVLTGWDVGYGQVTSGCQDEHVKEIGVWIDNWQFNKPGDPSGTLRYKLSAHLRDKNSDPGPYYRHKVTIIGIHPIIRKSATSF